MSDPSVSDSALKPSGRTGSSLKPRILTAVIGGTVALLAVYCTLVWPLAVVLVGLGWLAVLELRTLLGNVPAWLLGGLVAGSALPVFWYDKNVPVPMVALTILLIGTAAVWRRAATGRPHWTDALSAGWLSAPLLSAVWLHNATLDSSRLFSHNLLLMVLLPLWMGDTAAYFIGKHFGKRLLAPKVSPKKTWEGAVANFVVCILTAWITGSLMFLPVGASIAVGVLTGILGQAGDLLQSMLKRSANQKDSGSILPGHGGVLDRLDSFFLSSVPATLALWTMAPLLFHVKQ